MAKAIEVTCLTRASDSDPYWTSRRTGMFLIVAAVKDALAKDVLARVKIDDRARLAELCRSLLGAAALHVLIDGVADRHPPGGLPGWIGERAGKQQAERGRTQSTMPGATDQSARWKDGRRAIGPSAMLS